MARRGRKRKLDARRDSQGRVMRERVEVIPAAALDRRAEATGMRRDDKMLAKVDASSALGILHQRGILGVHHYDAGKKFIDAHKRWAGEAGAKPRTSRSAGIFGEHNGYVPPDATEEEWDRIKARFLGAKDAVPRGLCWSLVECVALDNEIPPRVLERGDLADKLRAELVRGMDALCGFFNIAVPEKDAASKAA